MTIPIPKTIQPLLQTHRRLLTGLTIGLLALLGGYSLGLAQQTQAARLATTHQAETYTELYFTQRQPLPTELVAGQAKSLSFAVTNHEATAKTYQYRVTLIVNGTPRVIDQGVIRLGVGGTQTQTVPVLVTRTNAQVEVIIELPDQQQTIHVRSQS